MKLWYQSTVAQTRWGARSRATRELLDSVKGPDTEIELHGPARDGRSDSRIGLPEPNDIEEIVENVRLAADRGFDAFLIGSIADPALDRTREIADIPVLGLCEASLKAAGMMGTNFSLVTVNRAVTPLIVDRVGQCGMTDRLAGVQDMGIERLREIDRGFEDAEARRQIIRRFLDAARASCAPGADVVVAADCVVMALLVNGRVEETEDGTPIVDGITHLVKLGEMAVKVNRVVGGRFTAERLDMAVEMLRSYDAAPLRHGRPRRFVTIGRDGALPGFGERHPAG
jgi:Asp/Glu/hydantoin racemase